MVSIVTERMPTFPGHCVRFECDAWPDEISWWQHWGVFDFWFCSRCRTNWGTVN